MLLEMGKMTVWCSNQYEKKKNIYICQKILSLDLILQVIILLPQFKHVCSCTFQNTSQNTKRQSSSCSKFTSPGANEDYAALVQIGESNGVCQQTPYSKGALVLLDGLEYTKPKAQEKSTRFSYNHMLAVLERTSSLLIQNQPRPKEI